MFNCTWFGITLGANQHVKNVQNKNLTLLFEAENYLDVARLTGKSIGVYIMTERLIHIAQTYQIKQLIC